VEPFLVAPVTVETPAPKTGWSDYWIVQPHQLTRAHKSGRRRLMIPKSSPVSWEELTGKRTTTVHKRNGETEIINDDWKTADPPDRAFDYSWTGTTVFERKFKPTHRLTTKRAPTASSANQQTGVELPAH
jgi:hypothetical protein